MPTKTINLNPGQELLFEGLGALLDIHGEIIEFKEHHLIALVARGQQSLEMLPGGYNPQAEAQIIARLDDFIEEPKLREKITVNEEELEVMRIVRWPAWIQLDLSKLP